MGENAIKALKNKTLKKHKRIGEIMQTVKISTSRDYEEYLLAALNDPERAANNIEVVLENQERLSGLLRLTLNDIIQ